MHIDQDSSLIFVAHSLGLSRLSVVTDGFADQSWVKTNDWFDRRQPSEALKLLSTLRGTEHLRLQVLVGAYYAFQPNAYSTYKDSALFFLTRAREESKLLHDQQWSRQALCLLAKIFVEGNALEQGALFFNQCIAECQAAGDKVNEAKAWMYRGLYTPYSPGTTKDRIDYLQKALELYKSLKRSGDQVNIRTDLGYLWVSELDLKKGEEQFRNALSLEDSIGFPYTHYTADNMSMVLQFQGKYGEPLKFSLQSIKTAEAIKDSIEWGIFCQRIGYLYSLQDNKRKESLGWLYKSLNYSFRTSGDPYIYKALQTIVDAEIEVGRPVKELIFYAQQFAKALPPQSPVNQMDYHLLLEACYLNLKQYDEAEQQIMEVARLEKKSDSMRGNYNRSLIFYKLGELYFFKGQYKRAKENFALYLSEPASALRTSLGVYHMLYTIDSAGGNYISAMDHLSRYASLLDSSLNIQLARQAEELDVQYEMEQKENEIVRRDQHIHLLLQADTLRRTSLQHAEYARNITIGGIFVSLIIAGLLYGLYLQKRKIAKVTARKNELLERLLIEKEWLLKEVHHRVKNNLHTVVCLLESQAKFLQNDELKVIENSQHRIYAMSLIHQKVYQSEDIKTIDMGSYLPEFIGYLRESFDSPAHIYFKLDIEPIKLGVAQAIPIALIVNEAVTNSIKHAFPEKREAEVFIQLYRKGKDLVLSVADNGIGMASALKDAELNSLGLELIKGLAREIRGKIFFETEKGSSVTVIFDPGLVSDPDSFLNSSINEYQYTDRRR